MGMSRDTFYRYKAAVEEGGVEALFERSRRKPNLANRVDEATEQAVLKSALEFPAYGQARCPSRKPHPHPEDWHHKDRRMGFSKGTGGFSPEAP